MEQLKENIITSVTQNEKVAVGDINLKTLESELMRVRGLSGKVKCFCCKSKHELPNALHVSSNVFTFLTNKLNKGVAEKSNYKVDKPSSGRYGVLAGIKIFENVFLPRSTVLPVDSYGLPMCSKDNGERQND